MVRRPLAVRSTRTNRRFLRQFSEMACNDSTIDVDTPVRSQLLLLRRATSDGRPKNLGDQVVRFFLLAVSILADVAP